VVFLVTALGAFMASLDLSIVNVAFPALQRSFPHDSRAALAWVITGYSIVFARGRNPSKGDRDPRDRRSIGGVDEFVGPQSVVEAR